MAAVKIEKYIVRSVEIIYRDKNGQITQRRIRVNSIGSEKVRAYDLQKSAPRYLNSGTSWPLYQLAAQYECEMWTTDAATLECRPKRFIITNEFLPK